jgi:hypothetical protein
MPRCKGDGGRIGYDVCISLIGSKYWGDSIYCFFPFPDEKKRKRNARKVLVQEKESVAATISSRVSVQR